MKSLLEVTQSVIPKRKSHLLVNVGLIVIYHRLGREVRGKKVRFSNLVSNYIYVLCTQLYNSLCSSIRPSDHPSVGPSVSWSIGQLVHRFFGPSHCGLKCAPGGSLGINIISFPCITSLLMKHTE